MQVPCDRVSSFILDGSGDKSVDVDITCKFQLADWWLLVVLTNEVTFNIIIIRKFQFAGWWVLFTLTNLIFCFIIKS